MKTIKKVSVSFWVISIFALLWNLMGVYQFYLGNYELESIRNTVTIQEFSIMESLPLWYSVIFAIAVFSGVIGCVLLFLKKKIATLFFMISLITVLIVELYWLLGTTIIETSGISAIGMPLLVIVIAIFLYFYSKRMTAKGWLN